jgi:integrase
MRENNSNMRKHLSQKEIKRIMSDRCLREDTRGWMVIGLILATGATQKEVVSLMPEDLIEENGRFMIALHGTKKDYDRLVPCNRKFFYQLKEYVTEIEAEPGKPIWPYTRFSVSVWIRNCFTRGKVYNVLPTAQTLRTTYIVALFRRGFNLETIKEMTVVKAPRQMFDYQKLARGERKTPTRTRAYGGLTGKTRDDYES